MTVDEIFAEVSAHMVKGMMVHESMANYYDFLGLCGYKRCHEYHYLKETLAHRALNRYFINHHNKLVPYRKIDDPEIIPETWYGRVRQDADANTKKNGVRNGLAKWVDWEKDTKKLYEQMYKELMDIGEVASAMKFKELICDVDHELKNAERYQLNKEATNYDINGIIAEQRKKHNKYEKMMKEMGVHLC